MLPELTAKVKPIAIYGAGGLGREILMLLNQINALEPTWDIRGFYDDNPGLPDQINGMPYLGTQKELRSVTEPLALVLAIGDPLVKSQLAAALQHPKLYYPVLLHPSVSHESYQYNQIGAGTVICQSVILTTNITIGQHVLVNLGCTVGHDAVIGDFTSLMPQVDIGGFAQLHPGAYLGTKATVLPSVQVGADTIVGAGAVVTRDLPARCTAVGVPAKIIKKHDR